MPKKNAPKKSASKQTNTQTSSLWHPRLIAIALLFVCVGIYLRLEPVWFNSTHFSYDQGIDQILVKDVVVDHHLSLISRYTGLEGVFMGPLYTWLMAIPFALSGGNPHGNVIFLTFLNLISTVATYILVRRMSNHTVGLFAALMTIIGQSFVASSRIVLSPAPLTFLSIFYLYLIWAICFEKRDWYIPVLALLISSFFQFEIGYAIFALPAAGLAILKYRRLSWLKPQLLVVSMLAFIIPFLPQIAFDLRHDFHITQAIKGYLDGSNQSLGEEGLNLAERFFARIGTFRQDLFSTIAGREDNYLLAFINIALIADGWWLMRQEQDKQSLRLFNLIWLLVIVVYVGFVIYSGPVWPWYRAGMPLLFSCILALSWGKLWQARTWSRPFIVLVLAFFAGSIIDWPSRVNAWNRIQDGNPSAMYNQHQTLDSIYADAQGNPFALYVYTPPVYPWIWDYQLWWYAQRRYGYLPQPYDRMPQTDNPELIYLLIEPPEYESDMLGWRDNFSHYGEMVNSWSINQGIRVEKWRFETQPENTQSLIKYSDVFSTD